MKIQNSRRQTVRAFRVVFVGMVLLVATEIAPSAAPPAAKEIRFEPGSICTRVKGKLAKGQIETLYKLEAREGQHMIVNIAPGGGTETANACVVIAPSGEQDGNKGGIVYDHVLTETGEYTVRVGRNLMATEGGVAGYTLEIVIY